MCIFASLLVLWLCAFLEFLSINSSKQASENIELMKYFNKIVIFQNVSATF